MFVFGGQTLEGLLPVVCNTVGDRDSLRKRSDEVEILLAESSILECNRDPFLDHFAWRLRNFHYFIITGI